MEKTNTKKFKEVKTEIKDLEIGESIEGLYLDMDHDVGENKSSVLHIRPDGEEPTSIWVNDILNSKLKLVSIGEYIKITRTEDTQNKLGNRSYKTYKVFKA